VLCTTMRDVLLPRAACVVTSSIQSRQSDSAELKGRYVRYVRGAHPSTSLSPSVAATRIISACSAAPSAVSIEIRGEGAIPIRYTNFAENHKENFRVLYCTPRAVSFQEPDGSVRAELGKSSVPVKRLRGGRRDTHGAHGRSRAHGCISHVLSFAETGARSRRTGVAGTKPRFFIFVCALRGSDLQVARCRIRCHLLPKKHTSLHRLRRPDRPDASPCKSFPPTGLKG